MLSSPRLSSSREVRFNVSALFLLVLCLLALTVSSSAQQLSIPGSQSPAEPKANARQDVPVQIRAARGEAPVSWLYGNIQVDSAKLRRLPALSERAVQESSTLKRLRIGTVRAFQRPLDLSSDSSLYSVAEGEVRVMGVVSEGALYTRVHFTGMALPAGARVFVYSLKNPEEFYGPYENSGPSKDGTFWTPPMEGDGAVIEYFTPSGKAELEDAPFRVSEISHIYRDPLDKAEAETAEKIAGACNLDVTGDWSQVATSVGRLQFTKSTGEYTCTGTLLNNQTNDHTPYLLTANHCFATQAEAQTLRVYWNYNSGEVPPVGTPRTDGATLLATGTSSDFTFVRLTGVLPAGLFFSGWDATATPLSTSITGIHHPQGSYKRISFGTTISGCGVGLPGPCQNYTNARWSSGTTEGGSSGSGIWKGTPADARLVGNLTGGAASCDNLSGTDYYGSFSVTYPSIASFLTNGSGGPSPDDNLEENDSRAAARAMSVGTYNNLIVKSSDEDWYKVTVAAGATVNFTTNFTNSSGDIDLSLYRNDDTSPIVVSSTINNSETTQNQNSTGATATYYLRVYLYSGTQNSYNLTIQVSAPSCPVANPISIGQTLSGTLTASDCPSTQRSGAFSDRYTFAGSAAQQISITLTGDFNTYLYLISPSGTVIASDDNGGGGTNSRIPATTGNFTLPLGGTYAIEVTSFSAGATGSYSLNYNGPAAAFIGVTTNFAPEGGQAVITVTRNVDFSAPVTIDYATSDNSGLNPCNTRNGMASSRCDYATSVGTLRFAVGEQTKNLVIPIAEDVHVEGTELFSMTFSNATGIFLPTISFPLQIIDNDVVSGPNPIDQTPFFVRQHYIDFLGREPDAAGNAGWTGILNTCPQGSIQCDRIEVSSAFFRSEEFQTRGGFVYRFYPTAFGRIPRYNEFMPDIAKVSGFLSPEQLEANKVAFINEFMARTEFKNRYDSTINNPLAYVNALESAAGVTLIGKLVLVAELTAGRMTRAQVLRAIAESTEVQQKYYTESFVVMQYFGYLRRDPDSLYLNWINTMNNNNGDYRLMINGFMNSAEYRQRFGP